MIHVINATCRRCGRVVRVQGENATGDLYIDMLPEPTITAMCKNIMVCNEKTHRNQIVQGTRARSPVPGWRTCLPLAVVMTVWIVTREYEYEGSLILGVFSNETAANAVRGQSTRTPNTSTDFSQSRNGQSMNEAELLQEVLDLCEELNVLAFHSTDSRRDVGKGFPDLVLRRPERCPVPGAEGGDRHPEAKPG